VRRLSSSGGEVLDGHGGVELMCSRLRRFCELVALEKDVVVVFVDARERVRRSSSSSSSEHSSDSSTYFKSSISLCVPSK